MHGNEGRSNINETAREAEGITEADYNEQMALAASRYAMPEELLNQVFDSSPNSPAIFNTEVFNPNAVGLIDYAYTREAHNPKWDQYSSADYADYDTYHREDMAELAGPYKDYIKHLVPTDILHEINRLFAASGLPALERNDLPDFPKDPDAIKGWDMKWLRKHEFLRPLVRDWVGLDGRLLDDKQMQLRIRVIHTRILQLARERAKSESKVPGGHAITLGYYEDPATTEKISTPPNATSYLAVLITLKNAHRELLAHANYKDRYVAAKGVICHCCGTPNESAISWPLGGVKLRDYHSGVGNAPCRACRNAIDPVLARTGVYRVLPPKYQAKIDSIIAELVSNGGTATSASLTDAKEYIVAQIVKVGREEAHLVAKATGDSVEDLKAMMAELEELKGSA